MNPRAVESLQAATIAHPNSSPVTIAGMSRNFYILAATLGFFAFVSGAMTLVPSSFQPGLPANGSLWRTVALLLVLASLASALVGVLSNLFEQVDRHSDQSRRAARNKRLGKRGL